jgi:hypothetical protein
VPQLPPASVDQEKPEKVVSWYFWVPKQRDQICLQISNIHHTSAI